NSQHDWSGVSEAVPVQCGGFTDIDRWPGEARCRNQEARKETRAQETRQPVRAERQKQNRPGNFPGRFCFVSKKTKKGLTPQCGAFRAGNDTAARGRSRKSRNF